MTPREREYWDTQGYLILKNVLAARELAELNAAVDCLDLASQARGRDPGSFDTAVTIIENEPGIFDLIDHPGTIGAVVDLMGANVVLGDSQVMVRPPTPEPGSHWHFDGPKPYPFSHVDGLTPLLHLKVGFFLTNVNQPDMGNIVLPDHPSSPAQRL